MKLEDIGQFVELAGVCCLRCDKRLRAHEVKCYPHPAGIPLDGYEGNQWVYFECSYCDYQNSLATIMHYQHIPELEDI